MTYYRTLTVLAALVLAAPAAPAQTALLTFDVAAHVTCREAQAMSRDQRTALATFLADHAARHRGVPIPDGERGAHLAYVVRGGRTPSPDAYLLAAIDRAVTAELIRPHKR